MKYYATLVNNFYIPGEIEIKYGFHKGTRQYKLVIKAKSRAAANRRWKELTGSDSDIFRPDYTSETGNAIDIEFCDYYGEILGTTEHGERIFADLNELVKDIDDYKSN